MTGLLVAILVTAGCSTATEHVSTTAAPPVRVASTASPHPRHLSPLSLGFPRRVRATLMGPTSATGGLAVARPGTPVPPRDVTARVTLGDGLIAGLGNRGTLFGACYPVLSRDDGVTWIVDGPQFSNATADGGANTFRLTATSDGTLAAWGHGGNTVKITRDDGAHWFAAEWSTAGVDTLSVQGRRLTVRALGEQVPLGDQKGRFATWRYVSTDDGRTWQRRDRLPNVKY